MKNGIPKNVIPAKAGIHKYKKLDPDFRRDDKYMKFISEKIMPWRGEALPQKSFVLVGVPDDRGVAINNGRTGAKEGPEAIRTALHKLTLDSKGKLEKIDLWDFGNVDCSGSQEETYGRLQKVVADILKQKAFPIILGGGHDLSFGSLSAFVKQFPKGGIMNIDPHLDCRPPHAPGRYSSGAAFRKLLEESRLDGKNLCEFGTRTDCNLKEHFDYADSKKVKIIAWPADFKKTLTTFAKSKTALAFSFDMDSVNAAFAPGVSAINPLGLSAVEALEMIQLAARQKNLKMFEIMELNPHFDPDHRTAKLAARLIYELLIDSPK